MVTFEAIVRSFLWILRAEKELKKCCQSKLSAGSSSNLKDARQQTAKTWGKLSLELNLLSSSDRAERNDLSLSDPSLEFISRCSTKHKEWIFGRWSCVGLRNSLTLEAVKVRFGNGDVVTIGSHSFLLSSLSTPFSKRPQDWKPSIPPTFFHSLVSGSKVFTEFWSRLTCVDFSVDHPPTGQSANAELMIFFSGSREIKNYSVLMETWGMRWR